MNPFPITVTREIVDQAATNLDFAYLLSLLHHTHYGFAKARYCLEKSCRKGMKNRAEHYAIILNGLVMRAKDEGPA